MVSRTALIAIVVAAIAVGGAAAYFVFFANQNYDVSFPMDNGSEFGFSYELYGNYDWNEDTNTLTIQKGKTVTFIVTFFGDDDGTPEGFFEDDFIIRANGVDITDEFLRMDEPEYADLLAAMMKYFENKTVKVTFLDDDGKKLGAIDIPWKSDFNAEEDFPANLIPNGSVVKGIYTDSKLLIPYVDGPVMENLKLYVEFEDDDKEWVTVTFKDTAGATLSTLVLLKGSELTDYDDYNGPFTTSNFVVVEFYSAYTDEDTNVLWDFDAVINANVDVFVEFEAGVTVTFKDLAGATLSTLVLLKGSELADDYSDYNGPFTTSNFVVVEFYSAYTDEDTNVLWDFDAVINANVDVFVEFEAGVTVTFKDADGKTLGTKVIEKGDGIEATDILDAWAPAGYYFSGSVYEDDEFGADDKYVYGTEILAAKTLYVKFTKWTFSDIDFGVDGVQVFVYQWTVNSNTDIFIGYEYTITMPEKPNDAPVIPDNGDCECNGDKDCKCLDVCNCECECGEDECECGDDCDGCECDCGDDPCECKDGECDCEKAPEGLDEDELW
ncbi:MAG: hypothetical protein FWD37_03320, partial [Methanomassiliicoccaceae archaeon]|nr:hypothetical protein [Methanomassiliicoccaceae archaeon]